MKTLLLISSFLVCSLLFAQNTVLTQYRAEQLVDLPLKCAQLEYPNKLNQVLTDETGLKGPQDLHPAFYGCFDWHSSVHGHWLMVYLLKEFPDLRQAKEVRQVLKQNITKENIEAEIRYFDDKLNSSFERMYGWTWLLKLQQELDSSTDSELKEIGFILQPLSSMIVEKYIAFLPKLLYPIRTGEHTNTAFGLTFALDYAEFSKNEPLKSMIHKSARRFYMNDKNVPINYEPSGNDFLSPALSEANLMCRILDEKEFKKWFGSFLPEAKSKKFTLEVGKVSDRDDGHLVHLDGLNFSRAWCLYTIARKFPSYKHLIPVADKHLNYSIPSIFDGGYMGEHWLASFATYAYAEQKNLGWNSLQEFAK